MKPFIKLSILAVTVLISFSFILKFSLKPSDEKKYISIEKAIDNGIVSAEIISKGGHTGECIEINIKSLIDKDTLLRIEPGRRVLSDDSTIQDILIVKEVELLLAGREAKNISLFGFCRQSGNKSPGKGSSFDIGSMEDSTFIKLAEFLSKSNLPENVMQNAVWVLSDNHSISSIHNDNEKDKDKMKALYQLVASIKGLAMEYPWYTLKYKQDTAMLFSNRPYKFFGEIDYEIPNTSNVDLLIRNHRNVFVKNLFVDRPHHPNTYSYRFTLNVASYPKGKYYLLLYVDNQLKIKKEFEL